MSKGLFRGVPLRGLLYVLISQTLSFNTDGSVLLLLGDTYMCDCVSHSKAERDKLSQPNLQLCYQHSTASPFLDIYCKNHVFLRTPANCSHTKMYVEQISDNIPRNIGKFLQHFCLALNFPPNLVLNELQFGNSPQTSSNRQRRSNHPYSTYWLMRHE